MLLCKVKEIPMEKKINCKHGLTHKQEIEARRLRRKIEENDADTMKEIASLKKKWLDEKDRMLFISYLAMSGYDVLCSAILRIKDETIIQRIYFRN